MAPPVPHTLKRMTAQPSRPVQRYRPGKPTQEEDESSEEEEEEGDEQKKISRQSRISSRPAPAKSRPPPTTQIAEESDEDGFVTDEEDNGEENAKNAIGGVKLPVQTTAGKKIRQPEQSRSRSSDESAGGLSEQDSEGAEDSDSSEEESSSSEDEKRKSKFIRPTFIKKADRSSTSAQPMTSTTTTPEQPQAQSSNAILQTTSHLTSTDQTRRLNEAEALIKDKLERDLLARASGKKAWDDDEELAPEDQVDDRDGLDPASEHAAWKLRELKRLKRDREQMIAREKEIEEIERRRNLTQEERDAEDSVYLAQQKAERDGKGQAAYLAKYHHKGAFFQDDQTAEFLKKRDVMGARFVDDVDKSTLPEYMRIRDMTKLGKKGRTRYKDLKGEDTGRFGDEVKRWRGANVAGLDRQGAGGFENEYMDVDERFRPDGNNTREGPTGANASVLGQKRDRHGRQDGNDRDGRYRARSRSRPNSPERRHREDDVRRYRPSRSRSRSPDRTRSGDRERDRDKRRRVEV